jgi:hypothetical protein
MDITNIIENDKIKEKELFDNIDKKLTLRFEKQKKTTRTLITGLYYFFDKDEIKKFINSMKKRLGTGGIEVLLENGTTEIGFNGNHILTLKKIFIDEFKIDKDKIKS